MWKRVVAAGTAVVLLMFCAPRAQAAAIKPLRLVSASLSVAPPISPATACDEGSALNCGYVIVSAVFSGLDGRARPTPGALVGDLLGTARVTRIYGCQDQRGHRLHRYDRTVTHEEGLDTRRGTGYLIPVAGDTLGATTFAFLPDRQPGNCPAGTTAMTYRITASHLRLEIQSFWGPIPNATYKVHGRAHWCGAVPTPTPAAASNS